MKEKVPILSFGSHFRRLIVSLHSIFCHEKISSLEPTTHRFLENHDLEAFLKMYANITIGYQVSFGHCKQKKKTGSGTFKSAGRKCIFKIIIMQASCKI